MKLFSPSLFFRSIFQRGAATASETAPEAEIHTLSDTVGITLEDETMIDEPYSDEEMMALVMGGGERDLAKLEARVRRAKDFPLGSVQNPVRVNRVLGEFTYLSRLKCADGSRPSFDREGNFGTGPYETTLDGYNLTCCGVPVEGMVFMDMYHSSHIETDAIPGFTID